MGVNRKKMREKSIKKLKSISYNTLVIIKFLETKIKL